jgi:hypothetical protein
MPRNSDATVHAIPKYTLRNVSSTDAECAFRGEGPTSGLGHSLPNAAILTMSDRCPIADMLYAR